MILLIKILIQIISTFTIVLVPRISLLYKQKKLDEFNKLLSKMALTAMLNPFLSFSDGRSKTTFFPAGGPGTAAVPRRLGICRRRAGAPHLGGGAAPHPRPDPGRRPGEPQPLRRDLRHSGRVRLPRATLSARAVDACRDADAQ